MKQVLAMVESNSAASNVRVPRRNRLVFSTIRTKIIFPFLVLTMIVTMFGTFVVTRLVAANAQDRLTNQLLEASRAAGDNVVAWEERQLDTLRLTVFTAGIPEALRDREADDLSGILVALAANQNIHMMIGFDDRGTAISGVRRGALEYEIGLFAGQDMSDIPIIQQIVNRESDPTGDKYSGFVDIDGEVVLLTVAPVIDSDGSLIGVIGVGTLTDTILSDTKANVLADLTVYQEGGEAIQTTFVLVGQTVEEALSIPSATYDAALESEQEITQLQIIEVNAREFQTAYVPLKVRNQTLGVMGISWPATFVSSLITTNRNGLSVMFAIVALLVVVVGYIIAGQLTKPIRTLASTAQLVSQGDLERQSGVRTSDEIGVLGQVFDNMTVSLGSAYRQQERERAFLEAVIASAADGTFVISEDGTVTHRNPVANNILGYDRKKVLDTLSRLVGQVQQVDIVREQVTIGDRYYDALATPVITQSDERIGVTVTMRDVTDQVHAERMRQTFIMQMSHELFTPLTAIKGYIDLAAMVSKGDPKISQLLEQASDGSQTLNRLISQMMDVSSMIRGGFEIREDTFDLNETLEEALAPYMETMINKGIRLETEFDPLPVYYGDAGRLRWAFSHLIANAVTYTVSGGWINIYTGLTENGCIVRIRDTGIGIFPQDKPHVFDLFYRGKTITEDGIVIDERGTGVGLYIVRQVITAHGGRVDIRSKAGVGTEVIVTLPDNRILEDA